jgi:AraC-like DNA-binding protein
MRKASSIVFASSPEKRRRWSEILASMYQPQATTLNDPRRFSGRIVKWRLGHVDLSLYDSGAVHLTRTPRHVHRDLADQFFVVIPRSAPMTLLAHPRPVPCAPGQLIIQDGCSASGWAHDSVVATAMRIPGDTLRQRVAVPNDYCGIPVACDQSAGALFAAFAHALVDSADTLPTHLEHEVGDKIVDLLTMTLDASTRPAPQADSAAQTAQRVRVMRFIEIHFRDPDLNPARVAAACGISLRYLHRLFAGTEWTVAEWIIERRLVEAGKLLRSRTSSSLSVAEVAYRCGFNDPSHFSRRFKARYHVSPGEARHMGATPDYVS